MDTHVKVVGALNVVLGAFGLLVAAALMLIFGGATWLVGATGDPDAVAAIPILGLTGAAISTFCHVRCPASSSASSACSAGRGASQAS